MLIDWFTVLAQAVNFLILIWLLQRFLYRPVLAAIDAREKKIATELADAAARKTEAQKERDDFRGQSEALQKQREALLRAATDDANKQRETLIGAARQEADALRGRLNDALVAEQNEASRRIVTRTRQEVFAVARKLLVDLADTNLQDLLLTVFIRRLHELRVTPETAPAGTAASAAQVFSAFALTPVQCAAAEKAVREFVGDKAQLSFATRQDLICGIELIVDGRSIAWSVDDYLGELAEHGATDNQSQNPTTVEPAKPVQHAA